MPEDWTTYCTQCHALGSIESVRLAEMSDEGQTGGVYRCSECLAQYGVWIDAGTLDLGIVRESVEQSDSNFTVFTDPPLGQ